MVEGAERAMEWMDEKLLNRSLWQLLVNWFKVELATSLTI